VNRPEPLESAALFSQQQALSHCLENAGDWEALQTCLAQSELSRSEWNWEQWEPAMLETAWKIARKWKNGF
jgi:hypothetical protein